MTLETLPSPRTRFALPSRLEASAPPEQRGLSRDEVRLLVVDGDVRRHRQFRDLPKELVGGDLLVVNTSATLAAALRVWRSSDPTALMHVSGVLDDGAWVVELRRPANDGPDGHVLPGEQIGLAGGTRLTVADSYPVPGASGSRLWRAVPDRAIDVVAHLTDHGQPICYGHVRGTWPLSDLQNVYADQPGSAEMASAGRPISERVLADLHRRGVSIARVVLHTGVSSPEKHEPPLPERFEVGESTAALVNSTRDAGHRVIAVGTTVVRALESAADHDCRVRPRHGWTELVVSRRRPVRVVDGLISGLHEPAASHLLMLEAVAGETAVQGAYDDALAAGYLWHEFGDSMLLLRARRLRGRG